MIQVYEIDKSGYYIKPVIINEWEDITDELIDIPPPDGLYRAKWTGEEWVEDMSQEEIDELSKPIPNEKEIMQEQIDTLALQMLDLMGV